MNTRTANRAVAGRGWNAMTVMRVMKRLGIANLREARGHKDAIFRARKSVLRIAKVTSFSDQAL